MIQPALMQALVGTGGNDSRLSPTKLQRLMWGTHLVLSRIVDSPEDNIRFPDHGLEQVRDWESAPWIPSPTTCERWIDTIIIQHAIPDRLFTLPVEGHIHENCRIHARWTLLALLLAGHDLPTAFQIEGYYLQIYPNLRFIELLATAQIEACFGCPERKTRRIIFEPQADDDELSILEDTLTDDSLATTWLVSINHCA